LSLLTLFVCTLASVPVHIGVGSDSSSHVANVVPVPPAAQPVCQNCSTKGYDIIVIDYDIYAFTDGGYWALAVLNTVYGNSESSLTIVDAWQGDNYFAAIQDILTRTGATTVKNLVYSHYHTDHIGSAGGLLSLFPDIEIIAHVETYKSLKRVSQTLRPLPTVTFTQNYTVREANLCLRHVAPAHTYGDILIYHPPTETLMYVDVIFPYWVPFWNMAVSADIPGMYDAFDTILSYKFKVFVGGHLTRLGDRAAVKQAQQYLLDIKASAERIFPTLDFNTISANLGVFDSTSPNYGNLWASFNTLLDMAASQCEAEVSPKWIDVIGGVDVWTYSQCWALTESLRLDF